MALIFQGFPAVVDRGAIRFDLHSPKRASNGVQKDTKSQGGRPTLRRSCPWLLIDCKLCCHTAVTQEGRRPSCDTRRNRTPASRLYGFCGSDNVHDNPRCYLTSLLFASLPFPSGGFAACPPREGVGERIGKEWVID